MKNKYSHSPLCRIGELVEHLYILPVLTACICTLTDLDMVDDFIHRSPVKHLQIQILLERRRPLYLSGVLLSARFSCSWSRASRSASEPIQNIWAERLKGDFSTQTASKMLGIHKGFLCFFPYKLSRRLPSRREDTVQCPT